MTAFDAALPDDPLADLAPTDAQRHAAQLAGQAFSAIFRVSANEDEGQAADLQKIRQGLQDWVLQGDPAQARAARLAMLLSGLDQWGVAYTQAFGLTALPLLSAAVGDLRSRLDARDDALFQQVYARLNDDEAAAIDFKVALRRDIHLALWHAMISCESMEAAESVLRQLGSMFATLVKVMPTFGWRLVADALAHVQIQCLSAALAQDGVGRQSTQALFAALDHALDKPLRDQIMAHATQATIQWQQAMRRAAH